MLTKLNLLLAGGLCGLIVGVVLGPILLYCLFLLLEALGYVVCRLTSARR